MTVKTRKQSTELSSGFTYVAHLHNFTQAIAELSVRPFALVNAVFKFCRNSLCQKNVGLLNIELEKNDIYSQTKSLFLGYKKNKQEVEILPLLQDERLAISPLVLWAQLLLECPEIKQNTTK